MAKVERYETQAVLTVADKNWSSSLKNAYDQVQRVTKSTGVLDNTTQKSMESVEKSMKHASKATIDFGDTNEDQANKTRRSIENSAKTVNKGLSDIERSAGTAGTEFNKLDDKTKQAGRSMKQMATDSKESANVQSSSAEKTKSSWGRLHDTLSAVHGEAKETRSSFKSMFMGSALGNMAVNALSQVSGQLKSVYKDGMAVNAATAKINARFKAMGYSDKAIKALDGQIKNLKYNTAMSGAQVSDLQTKMLNWSGIGKKGAMQMTTAIGAIGDASKMSGDQIAQMGAGLMRVGSTGKVTYSSLSRITKTAPAFMSILAKGAGMSEGKLKKLLQSGKVTQKQFQKWLANSSKYADQTFKGYGKTQGAALKRMQDSWMNLKGIMMKPLFEAKSSGLQALSKLLTSKELTNGAKAIGGAISNLLKAVYKHRKDLTHIVKDLIKIATELGKAVWKDFLAIFKVIASLFGSVSKNSKKSKDSLDEFTDLLDGFAKNKTAVQVVADTLLGLFAYRTIKKVKDFVLAFGGGIKYLEGRLVQLVFRIKGASAAQKAFNIIAKANTFGLIVTAIVAVVGALVLFFTKTKTGRKLWAKFTKWLNNSWKTIKKTAKRIWPSIGKFITDIPKNIKKGWHSIIKWFSNLWNSVKKFTKTHWKTILEIVLGPVGVIIAHWKQISRFFSNMWKALVKITKQVWKAIKGFVEKPIIAAKNTVKRVINAIKNIFGSLGHIDLFKAGVAIINGFLNGLKRSFENVKNFVGGIGNWIKDHKGPLSYDETLLIPAGHSIMHGLNNGLIRGFDNVKSTIGNITNTIANSDFGVPDIDFSQRFDDLRNKAQATFNGSVNQNTYVEGRPAYINLSLGGTNYRAFVHDITSQQDRDYDLQKRRG